MVSRIIACTLSLCSIYDTADTPLGHIAIGDHGSGVQAKKIFVAQLFRMSIEIYPYFDFNIKFEISTP